MPNKPLPLTMQTIDTMLRKLDRTQNALNNPTYFFKVLRKTTPHQARALATQVLTVSRPQNISPEDWNIQIQRFVDLITATLVSRPVLGLLISGKPHDDKDDQSLAPSVNFITKQEIEQWIQAGQTDPKYGKRLTPDDADIDSTVNRIQTALLSPNQKANYISMRQSLEEFIHRNTAYSFTDYYRPILQAWVTHFSATMPGLFRSYFRSTWLRS